MNESLHSALVGAGWKSGTHRGFLRTNRSGIDFEVGVGRGREEGGIELRYRYHTENTHTEGDVALAPDTTIARIEDAMTGIYQRIHERPDPTRVFGSKRRTGSSAGTTPSRPATTATPASPPDDGQPTLDL